MVKAPTVEVAGAALDPTKVALPVSIVHGRSTIGNQPDAPQAAFAWLGPDLPFRLGDPVRITAHSSIGTHTATWGSAEATWGDAGFTWGGTFPEDLIRFTGRVVSLVASEDLWKVQAYEVTATGRMLELADTHVLLPRPAETDHERVAAIAAAAGVPVEIRGTETTALVADDIDRDALAALHELCTSTGALVWEEPDGGIVYGVNDHRDAMAAYQLNAEAILDGLEWNMSTSQIINHIEVEFGPEDAREQNTYRDDESIAEWGLHAVDVATLCADEAQASALAATILARRRNPIWNTPDMHVDSLSPITPADLRTANLLRVSDGVLLPIPATPGTVPVPAVSWSVEGWTERWNEPDQQELTFAISDRSPWSVHPLTTWDTMNDQTWAYWQQMSWLDQLTGVAP